MKKKWFTLNEREVKCWYDVWFYLRDGGICHGWIDNNNQYNQQHDKAYIHKEIVKEEILFWQHITGKSTTNMLFFIDSQCDSHPGLNLFLKINRRKGVEI